jgi:nitroreductase
MKKIAKKILPKWLYSLFTRLFIIINKYQIRYKFIQVYKKDRNRYLKYSRTYNTNTSTKLIGAIIQQYHVLEKGLTMSETRLGFGQERIKPLCNACIRYIKDYGYENEQIRHAIGVLQEYKEYHKSHDFILKSKVISSIENLENFVKEIFLPTSQVQESKNIYFEHINSSFPDFSNSRASVRNYTKEEVSLESIKDALNLARNTPSACNRQSWRTYVYLNKQMIGKILEAQGGNRGFGHLTNKLIIISGELAVFCNTNERNQVFIDGGMYAMNLLYALHSNQIATCIMNCSFDFEKELEIKKLSQIKESEVLIAMIACGIAPDKFMTTISLRNSLEYTNTIIP